MIGYVVDAWVRCAALIQPVIGTALLLGGLAWHGTEAGGQEVPRSPGVCELYAPGHFGNSYEVLGVNEMRQVLAEAKFWGFNQYGDWFDAEDCVDPLAPDSRYDLGGALWERKKAHFRSARALGLPCDLILTPNHVYRDQVRPEWKATRNPRIFGQLICPSIPEARKVILDNYERLFADLARSGVRLAALSACPYDYGGCACRKCQPWVITFAELCREIHQIARRHHPAVEMHFIGWWWGRDEHTLFAVWCDRKMPGWAKSMALHIPYENTGVADVALPNGCEKRAFVHIGYADLAQPKDTYGHLGPLVAPTRLPKTVNDLRSQGVKGVMAYSEGVLDDVNKALLGGLLGGRYPTGQAVLEAYAQRYFGAKGDQATPWAAWLAGWGDPFSRDAAKALRELDGLAGDRADWRRRQWELKARMLVAHQAVMSEKTWTPTRLAHVDAFWAAQEVCQREVWGLGPLRHIFGRGHTPLPWYPEWAVLQAQAAARIGAEQ
jgi:hypothetical protein